MLKNLVDIVLVPEKQRERHASPVKGVRLSWYQNLRYNASSVKVEVI